MSPNSNRDAENQRDAGQPHAGHSHDHRSASTKGLVAAATLNTSFAFIQVAAGIAIGSVVVLADAAHQVVDAIGLLTALTAALLIARPSNSRMSFGWGKADALGGFISGLLLVGSLIWITIESVERLLSPADVDGSGVILIGLAGVAINGVSVLILGGGEEVLAIRAARLHLITDLAGSVLVVVTGLVLSGTDWTWVDPLASLALSVAVLHSTKHLLFSAAAELLDRTPSSVSTEAVLNLLTGQPGVKEVHHIHIRPLGQARTSVTAHVVVDGTQSLHDAQERIDSLGEVLTRRLDISHSTLQLECHPCDDDEC